MINGRKIIKIFGIGCGSILIFGLVAIASLWGLDAWNQRPKVVTELAGFKLGESKSDVEFKNGDISEFLDKEEKTRKYYNIGSVRIKFDELNKIDSISYFCDTEEEDYTSVNGIKCGDNSEKIDEKIYWNIRFCSISKDISNEERKIYRKYRDSKFNTTYGLKQNQVMVIAIWNSIEVKDDENFWSVCK